MVLIFCTAEARGFAARQQTLNRELQGEVSTLEQRLATCRLNYSTATEAVSQLEEEVGYGAL